MTDQNDARRRLLVALALERSRSAAPVDGVLRRALEGDRRASERLRLGGRTPDERTPRTGPER